MGGKEIYKSTKQFPTKLMGIGLIKSVLFTMLMGVVVLLSLITKNEGFLIFGLLGVLILNAIVSSIIEHYVTYMFKYGAVHAIATACMTGSVSPTYFNDSVDFIKNSFLKANVYLVVDRMVGRAVRGVTRLVNFVLGFLPDNIKGIVDTFINAYLNYIDECCLAYSICRPTENVGKTSCDGIVLYYQNAKAMLKPAAKVVLRKYLTVGIFYVVGLACLLIPIYGFNYVIAVMVILIGLSIYEPYLNHHILCDLIPDYLSYALHNEPQTDVYSKLQKVNPFRKLQEKQNDSSWDPAPGNSAFTADYVRNMEQSPTIESEVHNETSYQTEQSNVAVNVSSATSNTSQSQVTFNGIPMPTQKPSQEEIYWQQAWNRMSDRQKEMYKNMDDAQRLNWKRQILKSVFNYDM